MSGFFQQENEGNHRFLEDKRYSAALANLQFMSEIFSDSAKLTSGWFHDFVCPKCSSQMQFEVADGYFSPDKKFRCSNCNTEVSSQKHFEAWVYRYRRYFAENLDNVIVCVLAGDAYALTFLKKYVDFYANCYNKFPVHGKHAGKGKIMAQSLDEAVWGIYVLKAIYYCRIFFSAEQLESWYAKLFAPMAELLIPQVTAYNNICVWIQSCIGMIGLTFNKKDLVDTALNREFGLYKQLEKGLTKDYLWYEGSLHYHYFMLEGLTYFCELYTEHEPQSKLLLMLDRMYQAPTSLLYDNCHILSLNDGWYPLTLRDYAKQIIQAAAICKSYSLFDQVSIIKERFPEVFDDPATLLYDKKVDTDTSFLFDRHMAVMKKPFPVILKSGSCTPSHMHRDCLSVIIPPFSVDLGTPGYGSSMNDSWYRAPLSHNTVSIDGDQPRKLPCSEIGTATRGVEAVVKDWPGVIHASRSLHRDDRLISDETIIQTPDVHTFDWTFHGEGDAEYNLTRIPLDSLGKGYELFSDIQKVNFDQEFRAVFKNGKGCSLTVSIPFMPGIELFTAKTPGNPADHKRNTLLLRAKGTEARFEVLYSVTVVAIDKLEVAVKKPLDLQKRIKKLERELQNVKSGWSYRIGRIITYLPRQVRKFLKG